MKLYRIMTEDIGNVKELTAGAFAGATFIDAEGLWNHTFEYSLVVEILGTERDYQRVLALARNIKQINRQEAVIVQTLNVESELV